MSPFAAARPAEIPASLIKERRESCLSPVKNSARASRYVVSTLLCPLLMAVLLKDADGGGILLVRLRGQITEVTFFAQRRLGVPLGPLILQSLLARELFLSEIGELAAGQGKHEGHQIIYVGFAQSQSLHAAVEKR